MRRGLPGGQQSYYKFYNLAGCKRGGPYSVPPLMERRGVQSDDNVRRKALGYVKVNLNACMGDEQRTFDLPLLDLRTHQPLADTNGGPTKVKVRAGIQYRSAEDTAVGRTRLYAWPFPCEGRCLGWLGVSCPHAQPFGWGGH
jgi:hypothetical protein